MPLGTKDFYKKAFKNPKYLSSLAKAAIFTPLRFALCAVACVAVFAIHPPIVFGIVSIIYLTNDKLMDKIFSYGTTFCSKSLKKHQKVCEKIRRDITENKLNPKPESKRTKLKSFVNKKFSEIFNKAPQKNKLKKPIKPLSSVTKIKELK